MPCLHFPIRSLRQQSHNSKYVIFQEKRFKVLKCQNFLWVQRRHNCSPAASFANCVMTLYRLKVHLQTFLSIPITQKMANFELWHSFVANERYALTVPYFGPTILTRRRSGALQDSARFVRMIRPFTVLCCNNGVGWQWIQHDRPMFKDITDKP